MLDYYKKLQLVKKNEKGLALVVVMVVMATLSLLGVSIIMISSFEDKIAANIKRSEQTFYPADGGAEIIPGVLNDTIELNANPSYTDITTNDTNFINEVMGYASNNDGDTDTPNNNPDFSINVSNQNINIDVDRIRADTLEGGSIEFAAGYEGIGAGASGGGIAIYYIGDSQADGAVSTRSNVEIVHRKVLNVAGE
jgi:Tfp pilus assembly protein PilX